MDGENLSEEAVTVVDDATFLPETAEPEAVLPQGLFLAGRVIEKNTGEPVRNFEVELRRRRMEPIYEEVDDEDGSFSIPLEMNGTCHLDIYSSRHLLFRWSGIEIVKDPDGKVRLDIMTLYEDTPPTYLAGVHVLNEDVKIFVYGNRPGETEVIPGPL